MESVTEIGIQVRAVGATVVRADLTPPGPYTVGRAPDCDVVISDLRVSRHAGVLGVDDGRWYYERVGATEPSARVRVDRGRVFAPAVVSLCPGDAVTLALTSKDDAASPSDGDRARGGSSPEVLQTIGRSRACDVMIEDLSVSRHQAELRRDGDSLVVVDLGGHLGTFVDGVRVTEPAVVLPGSRVSIGSHSFCVEGARLAAWVPARTTPALEASHLAVTLPDARRILADVSFTMQRGTLLAVVGPTGAGKSTLLKALTGFRPPDAGEVLVEGRSLYENFEEIRPTLGYVPQDDILHPQLTVRRALQFGAELRFPPETTRHERDVRVQELIDELGLTHRADLPISRLSGGQRKRTSVAMELLTKPSLLFLDEPTSGLDPGYEQAVMELLRELADGGRAVLVVTHSLASLHLCDQVLFLAPGGRTAYLGPPSEALGYFQEADFPAVFRALEARGEPDAADALDNPRRVRRGSGGHPDGTPHVVTDPPSPQWRRQTSTLMRRQLAILRADRRNLLVLGLAAVVPALLALALVGNGALDAGLPPPRTGARILLAAVVITAAALGAANGLREIVKERAIYLRERAIGLRRSAYLTSKIAMLGAVTSLQCAVLVVIATLTANGPASSNLLPGRLELVLAVAACAVAALVLGLFISAVVSTSEKAVALIPVIFVVSWLFSGVAVDLQTKPFMRDVAYLNAANWGMSATASTVDLPGLEGGACSRSQSGSELPNRNRDAPRATSTPHCDARWHRGVANWIWDLVVLSALGLLFALAADWALARHEPVESERRSFAVARAWTRVRDQVQTRAPTRTGGPHHDSCSR